MARSDVTVSDIALLVRTPGNVHGYRGFTDDERNEAIAHARAHGVEVEELP
ncbi:MAG: hypothetical protein PGN30_10065 [Mycolicibacterium neoaurum]|uniref:hypothetical protein n=1 Tax=Mycolicibacterium neoaurum TaxID=1795 RepID=UPI002FFB01EA